MSLKSIYSLYLINEYSLNVENNEKSPLLKIQKQPKIFGTSESFIPYGSYRPSETG